MIWHFIGFGIDPMPMDNKVHSQGSLNSEGRPYSDINVAQLRYKNNLLWTIKNNSRFKEIVNQIDFPGHENKMTILFIYMAPIPPTQSTQHLEWILVVRHFWGAPSTTPYA